MMPKRLSRRLWVLSSAGLVCIMLLVTLASATGQATSGTLAGKTVPGQGPGQRQNQDNADSQNHTVSTNSGASGRNIGAGRNPDDGLLIYFFQSFHYRCGDRAAHLPGLVQG